MIVIAVLLLVGSIATVGMVLWGQFGEGPDEGADRPADRQVTDTSVRPVPPAADPATPAGRRRDGG